MTPGQKPAKPASGLPYVTKSRVAVERSQSQGTHHTQSLDFVLIAKGKYCEVLRQAKMESDVYFFFF